MKKLSIYFKTTNPGELVLDKDYLLSQEEIDKIFSKESYYMDLQTSREIELGDAVYYDKKLYIITLEGLIPADNGYYILDTSLTQEMVLETLEDNEMLVEVFHNIDLFSAIKPNLNRYKKVANVIVSKDEYFFNKVQNFNEDYSRLFLRSTSVDDVVKLNNKLMKIKGFGLEEVESINLI